MWTDRWMTMAGLVATWSKDKSRKVGCVIVDDRQAVIATGWNGFPRGVVDEEDARHERPAKYMWTEHAERNAIYNAASQGNSTKGGIMYCTLFPCADCARAIVQAGIKELVTVEPHQDSKWSDHFVVAKEMLDEVGIIITYVQTAETKILTMDEKKREYVQEILDACEGDRSKAAKALGISRNTVTNILK